VRGGSPEPPRELPVAGAFMRLSSRGGSGDPPRKLGHAPYLNVGFPADKPIIAYRPARVWPRILAGRKSLSFRASEASREISPWSLPL